MKKIIRLTESDLHRIVKKSVNKILREGYGENEGQGSQDQEIINQLLQLGLRDVTNVYKESGDYVDDEEYMPSISFDEVKQYLSVSGQKHLMSRGYIFQWFIDFGDRTFCSKHNFTDEDYAQENCDKYIKLINNLGGSCEAWVDGIFFEDGKYMMDTCLTYEDFGGGEPFWMD